MLLNRSHSVRWLKVLFIYGKGHDLWSGGITRAMQTCIFAMTNSKKFRREFFLFLYIFIKKNIFFDGLGVISWAKKSAVRYGATIGSEIVSKLLAILEIIEDYQKQFTLSHINHLPSFSVF